MTDPHEVMELAPTSAALAATVFASAAGALVTA
jgi:hypothetical protein